MNDESLTAEIQDRMRGAGELLTRLGERPEPLGELRDALDRYDASRFREVLEKNVPFEVPPDRCDPYVRVIVEIVKPPKFVRHCEWVFKPLPAADGATMAESISGGISAENLTELLLARGYLECKWVREDQNQFLEVDKFVQGVCPPGTY